MIPITYEFVKLLHEERLRRSLANFKTLRKSREHIRPQTGPARLAEVVELDFALDCGHDSIGA